MQRLWGVVIRRSMWNDDCFILLRFFFHAIHSRLVCFFSLVFQNSPAKDNGHICSLITIFFYRCDIVKAKWFHFSIEVFEYVCALFSYRIFSRVHVSCLFLLSLTNLISHEHCLSFDYFLNFCFNSDKYHVHCVLAYWYGIEWTRCEQRTCFVNIPLLVHMVLQTLINSPVMSITLRGPRIHT